MQGSVRGKMEFPLIFSTCPREAFREAPGEPRRSGSVRGLALALLNGPSLRVG